MTASAVPHYLQHLAHPLVSNVLVSITMEVNPGDPLSATNKYVIEQATLVVG